MAGKDSHSELPPNEPELDKQGEGDVSMSGESEEEEVVELSQKQAKAKKTSKANQKENTNCLACNKKCTGSQASVYCQLCSLWCHKSCAGMSDAVFKSLALQMKEMGMAYWACRSCLNFATKTNALLKNMDKQLQNMNTKIEKNAEDIGANRKELKRVDNGLKNVERQVEEVKRSIRDEMYEEIRERDSRKLNLVLHGVQEPEDTRDYRAGIEKDKEECSRIFAAINAGVRRENLKFCKRLGEKTSEPRPIVIGLTSEESRRRILERNRDLQNSRYSHVSIVADLTKKQREEEKKLLLEAERRNRNLSTEEKSKNLKWLVVGRKGEKRLIKGEDRSQSFRNFRTETGTRARDGNVRDRRSRDPREARAEGRRVHDERGEDNHRRHNRSQEQADMIRQLEEDLKKAKAQQEEKRVSYSRGPGKRTRRSGTESESETGEPLNKATRQ